VKRGKSFIAQLRCKPDRRDELVGLQIEMKSLVEANEADTLNYELLQSEADENLFICVATFRDDAAFEKHMTIDFHQRLVPLIFACLAEDMKIEWFRSLSG
jgi:quinol monooxygenase YgiN